jgi:hypothetical protein
LPFGIHDFSGYPGSHRNPELPLPGAPLLAPVPTGIVSPESKSEESKPLISADALVLLPAPRAELPERVELQPAKSIAAAKMVNIFLIIADKTPCHKKIA